MTVFLGIHFHMAWKCCLSLPMLALLVRTRCRKQRVQSQMQAVPQALYGIEPLLGPTYTGPSPHLCK